MAKRTQDIDYFKTKRLKYKKTRVSKILSHSKATLLIILTFLFIYKIKYKDGDSINRVLTA